MIEYVFPLIILGLVSSGLYALTSIGLSLLFGVLGNVNATHGDLVTLGAYIVIMIAPFVPNPFLYLLISALAIGPIGLLINKTLFYPFRVRGKDISKGATDIILTSGLSIIISNVMLIVFGVYYFRAPQAFEGVIKIAGIAINMQRIMTVVISLCIIILLFLFLKKTKIGTAIRAVSQNVMAAQSLGINIENIFSLTWFLSAALAGVAGALISPLTFVSPEIGFLFLIKTFAIVVFGGLGNIHGAIFGSFILGITESVSQLWLPTEYKVVVSFAIMFIMLIVRPSGIFGRRFDRSKKFGA
jgi:branched-chain amino acid transport system permease protein